ncbi:hypothetical protein B0J13DRAFT_196476 [Dactylonectria estremocensis]|uniref:Uncharacterized protein n=1 Tax=Dactylonectria estremocensis TaxID=1079267 RepID=A0A9P9DGA4_9HYPO|nr:hypothetical protein B0J13DRAFT_196476 [Dactylonectria estremocensis]
MVELMKLPNETLEALCWCLCSHCFDRGNDSNLPGIKALSALSKTCRRLRDIAQPVLFHYFDPSSENPVPLLRNLLARPDLAANIQEACIGEWDIGMGLSSEDIKFCESTMAMFSHPDGSPFNVSASWFSTEYVVPGHDILFVSQPEVALAAIAMTLMPNVQTLELEVGYHWRFPFCLPGSLPHLTKLDFRHGDTELGQDLIAVEELLAAATNLKIFNCYMLSRISGNFFHQNVVELNLTQSHLEARFFGVLMMGLPNLSIFTYEAGGAHVSDSLDAYPDEISQALHIRADTLQRVSLNLEETYEMEGVGPLHVMTSLKEMKRLKCLVIPSRAIYGDDEDGDETDGFGLTNLLPKSIEDLTIEDLPANKLNDLLELGKVATTLFPSLVKLQVLGLPYRKLGALGNVFCQTKIDVMW